MATYIVTELAGPKVAGRRVSHGDPIDLTENEARAELLAGVIALPPEENPAGSTSTDEAASADVAGEPKKRR